MSSLFGDISVTIDEHFVATVELHRPPNNFFDVGLIRTLAEAYESLDDDPACRAILLCSEGKHFCAGADFNRRQSASEPESPGQLYTEAVRLFAAGTPVVAAIQGAAIGGGLGLACSADFRVACPEARFAANFARLGFHHGFGLSVTLPGIVGQQHALELLYTGCRIDGQRAHAIGLCDRLVPGSAVRAAAHELAVEIAKSAPLAVRSIRQTLRGDLADRVRTATQRENAEQEWLRHTSDWAEGVQASAQRREPLFQGK
jgi:enoyl-CoA hydratase/carnithine racemase